MTKDPDMTFNFPAADCSPERMKRLAEIQGEQQKIIRLIEKDVRDSEGFKACLKMAGRGIPGGVTFSGLKWNGSGFTAGINLDKPQKPFKPAVVRTYVDPKVANNLINSKLLTDDEKRRLLKTMLPDGVLDGGDEDGR